jgi:hypothetical protein
MSLESIPVVAAASTASLSPAGGTPSSAPSVPSGSQSPGSFPGQTTTGESPVNPVALARSAGTQLAAPASLVNGSVRAMPRSGEGPMTSMTSSTLSGAASPTAATSSTHPDGGATLDYGYLIGTIVDSRAPHAAISGATVSAEPLVGFCPSVGCVASTTGAGGAFKVAAAVGENEILIQDSYYMTNRTWAYVTVGSVIDVGTLELVADGFVTGVLLGSDPSHEPATAINITGTTRDGAFVASPSAHSNSGGAFTVAVPPVPSEISFTPIFADSPYETNYTFVNVSAGKTLDLGTIYMQRSTVVSVEIIDSVTGGPIEGTAASLTVCSKVSGYCTQQGTASGGPTVMAAAPVGPDSAQLQAVGFVENLTSLGWVPAVRVGSAPVAMGVIDLVPIGGIEVWANITGVKTPYGSTPPTSVWPVGEGASVYVTACDLDGLSTSSLLPDGNLTSSQCTATCAPPGTPAIFAGVPLRNYVNVEPATSTQCDPYEPLWPIPGDLPVFANYGWVNVTPGYLTDGGGIDLLPGTYIEGQVLPASSLGWDTLACSTDEPSICGGTSYADAAYEENYYNFPPNGCPLFGEPNAGTTFCVAAPPGPVKIEVSSPNASQNFTWAYDTPLEWPQLPLPLETASLDRVQSINLTGAVVTGRVLQARSQTPVAGLPAVEVCPAGTAPAAVSCETGVPNSTGFFKAAAPIGWDRVTVSAPDYVSNATWVYVERSNSTGTILITPFGYIGGQVIDSSGNGVLEATVKLCPITNPASCSPIGSDGLASTGGFYYGAAPAGSLPKGSYEVIASAPGYSTDWTWVNVTTPGENFTVPTITLQLLSGSAARPAGRLTGSGEPLTSGGIVAPLGEWVTGTVIDSDHDIALPTAAITADPVSGAPPVGISSIRGTGGEFNDSLPTGAYYVEFQNPGFYPATTYLNVSGNVSEIDMGTITLQPFPTVAGRLVIDPASWREGVTYQMGLGPGLSNVEICTTDATLCGPTSQSDSGGDFNTSAPAGKYDSVSAAGTGTGPGTFPGGFDTNQTSVNVTNATGQGSVQVLVGLAIYGVVTGEVLDGTSQGSQPVRYDSITMESEFPITATQGETLTADGGFAIIFPESEQLNMTIGGSGSWIPINATLPATIAISGGHPELYLDPGAVLDLGARFSLQHFGWIDIRVTNAVTGQPVPYATVTAQEAGILWGALVFYTATGVANGGGYLNLSAPPSIPSNQPLNLNVSAPDYSYQTLSVTVNSSRTTFANGTSPFNLGGFRLTPWAWITGQVSDAVSGLALASVSVSVTDPLLQSGTSGVTTNGLGVYVTDAPVSVADSLSLSLSGYSSNLSRYNVSAGAWVVAPPVHLTGDGVVEGRVVSYPAGAIVAGATVAVCPKSQPNCPNLVTTNASGYYAITAAPGDDAIVVSAPGFVGNTPEYVLVTSDSWIWAGVITLYEFAHVTGTVLGLPEGLPLAAANASLCGLPAGGESAGPCFVTVETALDGSFNVQAPAGVYVLEVNTTFYNDSYLTVSLAPGVTLSAGTIFIQEFGTATGTVDSSTTDSAVASATISACENWAVDVCTQPTRTGTDGQFVLSGPPGPYTVQATAAGYQSGFAPVLLSSATTTFVPTFLLVPIGPDNSYTVSGSVVSGAAPPEPLVGAVVTASGGASAYVGTNGNFSFVLPWGTYNITASLTGYAASMQAVTVNGPVSGLVFTLLTMTYSVTGVVSDGLSGQPLARVEITENGVPVGALTSANGAFSLELSNGTHSLVAELPADGGGYAPVSFVVVVGGASVVHDLSLYPPAISVEGIVASALSGSPISGASVTLSGMTSENLPWSATATSGPDGRFVALVYPGNYEVSASQTGFTSDSVALQLNSTASVPVTLDLAPMSPASTTGTTSGVLLYVAAGIGGAAILAAALILWVRRPPSSPPSRSSARRSPPGQDDR